MLGCPRWANDLSPSHSDFPDPFHEDETSSSEEQRRVCRNADPRFDTPLVPDSRDSAHWSERSRRDVNDICPLDEKEKRGGDRDNQRRLTPTSIVCRHEHRTTDEKKDEEEKTNEKPSASNRFCPKKESEASINIRYQ